MELEVRKFSSHVYIFYTNELQIMPSFKLLNFHFIHFSLQIASSGVLPTKVLL